MTSGFLEARRPGSDEPMYESAYAIEHDPRAAETYRVNFGDHVDCRPIQEVEDCDFPFAEVVIGGPPCQGFSSLNRNREDDHRRVLWKEYERALRATGASLFVMENVPQLLTSPEFADLSARACANGWHIVSGVLNAADYGVPQTRKRAIAVGSLLGRPRMPQPTHTREKAPVALFGIARGRQLLPWLTVEDAIGHLPGTPDGRGWHRARNATATSRIRYQHVPVGGDRFDMQASLDAAGLDDLVPRCWRNKPTGTTDVFGRMWWDRPAPTLRAEFYKPEKGRYLHPVENRPITIREGALLMGFPEHFRFPEGQALTHVGRQIGNAVPPGLAREIAKAVASHAAENGRLLSAVA
jgi:DNA (cytosine-5)-methyltransferase 1